MKSDVCTLFEGDYHYGVGALANSLYKHGYRGVIWAGYRGSLPPWAKQIERCDKYSEYHVAEGCVIRFVRLSTSIHFANYKPNFMLDLWTNYCLDTEAFFYFDPDIVIKTRWSFYEEWVSRGVALCEDMVYARMSSDHPIRLSWVDFAQSKGYDCHRRLDRYFNSGFIGVRKDLQSVLSVWQDLTEQLPSIGVDLNTFMPGDRSHSFYAVDQDTLNLSAMVTQHPLSTIGPEGMDFSGGGFTMSHAFGVKPWRKQFARSAISGFAPTLPDKQFLANTRTPINLYSPARRAQMQINVRSGAALGRFIRKS